MGTLRRQNTGAGERPVSDNGSPKPTNPPESAHLKPMSPPLRPIEPEEVPFLREFGAILRGFRVHVGATQSMLGIEAQMHPMHVYRLERGARRTRLSTIWRLASALADFSDGELDADDVAELLVEAVGPALAPESKYEDVLAKRRARRQWEHFEKLANTDYVLDALQEEIRVEAARLLKERAVAQAIAEMERIGRRPSKFDNFEAAGTLRRAREAERRRRGYGRRRKGE